MDFRIFGYDFDFYFDNWGLFWAWIPWWHTYKFDIEKERCWVVQNGYLSGFAFHWFFFELSVDKIASPELIEELKKRVEEIEKKV